MNTAINNIFNHKKPDHDKLAAFGFVSDGECLTYTVPIAEGQFLMTVDIKNGEVYTKVVDSSTGDEYILHRTAGAAGAFVGMVREAHDAVLSEIAECCFKDEIYKSVQTHELFARVREKYGCEPEFLWKKFPDCSVLRRKDTNKWFAAIIVVSRRKLGLDSDEPVEIVDLRMSPEELEKAIDNRTIFAGYHMNKKHWITIPLDGSLSIEELMFMIDESYKLAR